MRMYCMCYLLSVACVSLLCASNGLLVGLLRSVPMRDGKFLILVSQCTMVYAQVCHLLLGV